MAGSRWGFQVDWACSADLPWEACEGAGVFAINSGMFLRSKRRFKNGKWHRYCSVVENRRLAADRVVQRQVLYLGEINDTQEAAWRKTLEVFDEQRQDDLPDVAVPRGSADPAGCGQRPVLCGWATCGCVGRGRSATAGWA